VSPYSPSVEDAMRWGGNYAEAVTQGEYWRLWTSNYLHYGILHLAVNMLSLNNIGRMLERFIGKWRFAMLYTVTGIFASAVSIWWNQNSVGVGASGAILGIVGVLAALCTTNLIEKAARVQMLKSIGISILLMLAIGLNAGIDNAAHLGGLLAGAIGGYFIYPELRAFYYQHKTQFWGMIAACLLIAGGSGYFVFATAGKTADRTAQEIMEDLLINDYAAQRWLSDQTTRPSEQELRTNLVAVYERGLIQMDSIDERTLNEQTAELNRRLRGYIQSRLNQSEFLVRSGSYEIQVFKDSLAYYRSRVSQDSSAIYAR
jgi:rhomboid protease GluP